MYPGFHTVRHAVPVVVGIYICAYKLNIILLFCWFFLLHANRFVNGKRTRQAIHTFHVLFYEISVHNIFH
jgi:hypothetical protein